MIKLSVVIVLYNEFKQIQKCISSILPEYMPNYEILVIDNNSDLNGIIKLKSKYPKITFIRNKKNLGFAGAANIGFKMSRGEFVLLLTPDTKVLTGTIRETLKVLEDEVDIGAVSCRILSEKGKLQVSCFKKFPNLLSHLFEYNVPYYKLAKYILGSNYDPIAYPYLDHKRELNPIHMTGAYFMVRKKMLTDLSGFDQDYYMYREETDFYKRAHDSGWRIKYIPVGGLLHYGGGTWKKFSFTQASDKYMRSSYIFFKKHYGYLYFLSAYLIGFVSSVISLFFILPIMTTRFIQNKRSQSYDQFKSWITIFIWHLTYGLKLIL